MTNEEIYTFDELVYRRINLDGKKTKFSCRMCGDSLISGDRFLKRKGSNFTRYYHEKCWNRSNY